VSPIRSGGSGGGGIVAGPPTIYFSVVDTCQFRSVTTTQEPVSGGSIGGVGETKIWAIPFFLFVTLPMCLISMTNANRSASGGA
jgi:hypothetical protein